MSDLTTFQRDLLLTSCTAIEAELDALTHERITAEQARVNVTSKLDVLRTYFDLINEPSSASAPSAPRPAGPSLATPRTPGQRP